MTGLVFNIAILWKKCDWMFAYIYFIICIDDSVCGQNIEKRTELNWKKDILEQSEDGVGVCNDECRAAFGLQRSRLFGGE